MSSFENYEFKKELPYHDIASRGPSNKEIDISTEIDYQRSCFRTVRRDWIQSIKIIITSVVDVVGGWVFFIRTMNVEGLYEFVYPLYFLCLISSILSAYTIVSHLSLRFPSKFRCFFSYEFAVFCVY